MIALTRLFDAADNRAMRWRVTPVARPSLPRLDRERDALARLIETAPNATIAEMARIRLRAATFAAEHTTPTGRAIEAAKGRDAAEEPVEPVDLPHPHGRAAGSHLVDISAKLASLSAIAETNVPRYEEAADAALAEHAAAEARAAEASAMGAALAAAGPDIEVAFGGAPWSWNERSVALAAAAIVAPRVAHWWSDRDAVEPPPVLMVAWMTVAAAYLLLSLIAFPRTAALPPILRAALLAVPCAAFIGPMIILSLRRAAASRARGSG